MHPLRISALVLSFVVLGLLLTIYSNYNFAGFLVPAGVTLLLQLAYQFAERTFPSVKPLTLRRLRSAILLTLICATSFIHAGEEVNFLWLNVDTFPREWYQAHALPPGLLEIALYITLDLVVDCVFPCESDRTSTMWWLHHTVEGICMLTLVPFRGVLYFGLASAPWALSWYVLYSFFPWFYGSIHTASLPLKIVGWAVFLTYATGFFLIRFLWVTGWQSVLLIWTAWDLGEQPALILTGLVVGPWVKIHWDLVTYMGRSVMRLYKKQQQAPGPVCYFK
eukprot:TRINITY_DN66883_c7_g4_i1.p1 TRINITY_DN66883_c7_g4~~TRINITY_DN66883_c7_g4_i1.p1  ORF type:complete len:286 (+),score=10.05 TRINITY_DN66883_c7_g4_i1:24-860(+)